MKNLANEIVAWLKDYAVKSNRKAWVIGVSGGVDSALVSTLCAMTGLPTHCVILPCQTKPDETERGIKHITWLLGEFGILNNGIHSHRINLTDTFGSFQIETAHFYNNELAYANAKSRLRMIALYHIATCVEGLVVGTGNRVEDFGLGFFTKYGDGGCDVSPIADLTKTEVRAMCRELGVLSELAEAISIDGLWEDARTDESQLGATYSELEWAMDWISRYDLITIKEHDLLTERQTEVLKIYTKWHNAGAHKLLPIPTFERKLVY